MSIEDETHLSANPQGCITTSGKPMGELLRNDYPNHAARVASFPVSYQSFVDSWKPVS
jgi:hypothetical protein